MRVGSKSLIFGVHQFLWHPITVLLAWIRLFGLPNLKELICIFIHDWGYWFCSDMDGQEGAFHPEFGAKIAGKLFGEEYEILCKYHSRYYAKKNNMKPSKLCYADKYSITYDPCWFYLLRAKLSGELQEYRQLAIKSGISITDSDCRWFYWLRGKFQDFCSMENTYSKDKLE